MASTFFGLNISASALSTYQVAVNTTANNISNVKTEGYTRQLTKIETTSALRVTAKYGSCGTGVAATEVYQERDLYYDDKFRGNNSKVGFYEQSLYYLDQIQTIFQDDDVQDGFASILNGMFNSLDTLHNNGNDESVRNQFINSAQKLCTYFNSVSQSLSELQDDCNQEIKSSVNEINSIAKKISLLNKEINAIETNGGHANELRDARANLLDDLSSYVSVETVEHEVVNTNGENIGGTNFSVIINGQVLVEGNEYNALTCVERQYKHNNSDIEGLVDVIWADTGMQFAAASTKSDGSLKALFEVRDGNGAENLKGAIVDATPSEQDANDNITKQATITIKPSFTNVNKLDIPPQGQFTIAGKIYHYDQWEAEIDPATGEMQSVTFRLVEPLSAAQSANMPNVETPLVCGSTVDFMGVTYYQEQMNEFIREFTSIFNQVQQDGVTLDGGSMGSFFVASCDTGKTYDCTEWKVGQEGTYPTKITSGGDPLDPADDAGSNTYYQLTAKTVAVNLTSIRDPRYFATGTEIVDGTARSDLVEKLLPLQSDVTLFRGSSASKFLEVMISDITVDTQKKEVFYNNYYNLNSTIDTMRMSISGVDEDEEALNLIKFQNAYNVASKMISVMSELYNKLINETGVV